MKVTTSKASPELLRFFREKPPSLEIPWPQDLEARPAGVEEEPAAVPEVRPAEDSEKPIEQRTVEPEPVSREEPAAEPLPDSAPAEVREPEDEEVGEESGEVLRAETPKAPKVEELLESDEWIRQLTRQLIESEKRSLENGSVEPHPNPRASRSPSPLKTIWKHFRQEANRQRFLAKVAKYSQLYSSDKESLGQAAGQLAGLKRKFLKAIRQVGEPYRSTLVYHYCEGLSVAALVQRLEIPGWIIRERLIAALGLLNRKLEEELGKEKIQSYVYLAQLAKI